MEDRKRFFDALAAKYPPGTILREDAQKGEGRHEDLARRRSVAEARPDQRFATGKAEDGYTDMSKRRSLAVPRRDEQFEAVIAEGRHEDLARRRSVVEVLPDQQFDVGKAEGRHEDLAKRNNFAEARPDKQFDAVKAEDRPADLPKRKSVAIIRRERLEPYGRGQKNLSVLNALPSTFGMDTLDEDLADLAVTEVDKSMKQPQRSYSMMEAKKERTYEPDYNIMSESVFSLDESNFDDFIEGKEKALVMFYKNFQCPMVDFEANFAEVAESSRNAKHGFGAVDCVTNRALCTREKICCAPELKLYSNGFEVGGMMKALNATAAQMSMMVAMTPVLKKPKPITMPSCPISQTHKRASAMW